MKKIALVGQSHAVAVLDAIGAWRSSAKLDGEDAHQDQRYSTQFRGWFSVNTGGRVIEIAPRACFEAFSGMRICLLTPATAGARLAKRTISENNTTTIEALPALVDITKRIADVDIVISIINGNEHVGVALIDSLPPYDFLPFEKSPQFQPIDRLYINAHLASMVDVVINPLLYLRHMIKGARIFHVPPPPPLRDPAAAGNRELLEQMIEKFGFVRPLLRLKWYYEYIFHLDRMVTQLGVTMVDPRHVDAIDGGYLRPEFSDGLTHGNARYGELVAARVLNLISGG
jgi:hypothetical protein